MMLQQLLERSAQHLSSDAFGNEAQVRQGVIVPVLRMLGWDDTDPAEFLTEYRVDSGRVDYALLVHNTPWVFVEAKTVGNLNAKGEEQLFRYAANKGVPLLVLTDGNIWDFYLSMAAGEPPDRRFHRLEITAESGNQAYHQTSLEKFLSKQQVSSGKARQEAEKLHEDNQLRSKAKEAIPQAWTKLLGPPVDDMLVDLLAEEVHSICGAKPRQDDVEVFFGELLDSPVVFVARSRQRQESRLSEQLVSTPSQEKRASKASAAKPKLLGYRLDEQLVRVQGSQATLAAILNEFQSRDPSFLERLSQDPRCRTRTRVLISRTREDLYQVSRPNSVFKALKDGWWVGTDLPTSTIREKIQLACEIAGVQFGTQLTLIER